MSIGNINRSDLYSINYVSQSSLLSYPKEILIQTLRDYFSQDARFHFVKDSFGFVKNVDNTGLDLSSGLYDDVCTRIYIGEAYRHNEGIFYPAILVKNTGSQYSPISLNMENQTIEYGDKLYQDGYGNQQVITYPKFFLFAGAWESNFSIDVITRSMRDRDELVDLIALLITNIKFYELVQAGLVCKPVNIGSPSEVDDRTDKIFKQTISLAVRTEWMRKIPIDNFVEKIVYTIGFQNIDNPQSVPAENLSIRGEIDYIDYLSLAF
jgi:hypothetical protein